MIGEFGRSIADIEKTLALEPRHFGALSGLGLILKELGEDERALEAFEEALRIHPYLDKLNHRSLNPFLLFNHFT